MANLRLDNAEIVRAVLQVAGLGRATGNMDAATEADVRAILRAGLRRAYFPSTNGFVYQWRWLEKHHSLPIVAKVQTGTIGVSAGTVTLSGATWPIWVEDGFISVDGHVLFITEELTTTTASTPNTELSIVPGTSYTLFRYRYSLPSDFSEWLGGVVYANGTESRILVGADESEIRLRYAVGQGQNTRTTHYAITSAPAADAMRIMLWPIPEPDAFIQGTYLSTPDDNLPADLNTPGAVAQVGPIYAEMFLESILSAAESYAGDTEGIHEKRYQEALARAIVHDKSAGGVYDFSHPLTDPRSHGRVLPVEFESP